MRIASGRIIGGRVELDADLPEGAVVTVLAPDTEGTFEADAETEARLLQAIAECDRGEAVPLSRVLSELPARE